MQQPLYDSVVVMGKSYGPGGEPRELEARAAFGALCWHQMAGETLFVCLEGYDMPDKGRCGAMIARQVALDADVPPVRIVTRPLVNCTIQEARAIAAVLREYARGRPLVVTHPYHIGRTRRYLQQVGVCASMGACSLALARQLPAAARYAHLLRCIERGEPHGWNRLYNPLSERALLLLHALNPAGTIEQRLADMLRGGQAL